MRPVIIFGLFTAVASAGPVHASQIFDFSITNTFGNVPGTVTGQVILPFNGDGTGPATNAIIDTLPPGFHVFAPPVRHHDEYGVPVCE